MSHSIAIVGSGICGMCAAISLSADGHQVTVYERDGAPPEGSADEAFFDWQRNGAAQFRHPHAFLGLMCNLIQDNYPELMAEFLDAGARRVDFAEMLPPSLKTRYRPELGDERLWVLMCRRATMETVIRRYVATLRDVRIVNYTRVTGMLCQKGNESLDVHGLQVARYNGGGDATVPTDIVVDASGRTSKFPRWFRALGHLVVEEKADAEIVYYTKHYRLRPGEAEPPRGERPAAGDLGYLKFGVFPGDNGHFAIILCLPVDEHELKKAVRDSVIFDRICLSIPGVAPWLADGKSVGTTEPFGIGDIQSVWRHFVADGVPLATNFFAVGDAAVRTNPLYGRGCSTGVMHANILAEVIRRHADPVARAIAFHAKTEEVLRPIHSASLREDKNGIKRARAARDGKRLDKPGSLKRWFGHAFRDALAAASRKELHVIRGMMRTFHLLEPPGDFLKDSHIRRTIFRYMLRGRRRNAATRFAPGPDRSAMHALAGLETPEG